jgi:hypothetical protein
MLEVLTRLLPLLLVIGGWIAGLIYFDAFTPADVRAWRRLAAMRGYPVARSRFDKAFREASFIKKFQDELDLNRLLAVAGIEETPYAYLGRIAAVSFAITGVMLIAEFSYRAWQGDWFLGVGPWICLFIGVATYVSSIYRLRARATKRRVQADRALGDSLMLVGIMTDGRGLQLEDAVRILSRCVDNDSLERIIDHQGWKRLVKKPYNNTIEMYRLIAAEYGVPMFAQVADAAANTNVGMPEREMFTRVAKAVYSHRLSDARAKSARAKILVTLPVAGMLFPLLLLLGAPALTSITHGLAGH